MDRERRSDLVSVGLLVLLPLILFADVLFGAHDFFIRDLTRYYRPAKFMLRNIVLGGEFPYWNPYLAAGQPMAANPEHAVFYPPNWLVFLPDFNTGFRLLILLHLAIAGCAMYALLRSMQRRTGGAGPAAHGPSIAFLGAIAYSLGGLYLSYVNLLPILFSAAWVPLTCLFARRFLIEHRARDFACAALFLGVQFLAGEPSTLIQTAMLVCFYSIRRAFIARSIRPVLFAALIGVTGLAIGAVQMLPALDLTSQTVRARGIPFEAMSKWSMPALKVLELAFPNFLGHVLYGDRLLYWGWAGYGEVRPPYLFSIYVGLLAFVMAVAGCIARVKGWRFTLIVAAIFFVLAMGANTPLLRILYDLGIAGFLRFYEKFAFGAVFVLHVFSARVVDEMLRGEERLRRIAVILTGALAILTGAVALFAGSETFVAAFAQLHRLELSPLVADAARIAQRDWLFAFMRAAALCAILFFFTRMRREAALALLAIYVLADLAPLSKEAAPVTSSSQFTGTPRAAEQMLQRGGRFRLFNEADWHASSPIAQQYAAANSIRYDRAREGLFPLIPAEFGIATVMELDYDLTSLQPTADFVTAARSSRRIASWPQPFAAMSNAWYRGVYRPFDRELARAGGDPRKLRPVAFMALVPHPRYYFADRLVTIRDVDDFIARAPSATLQTAFIATPSFQPAQGRVHRISERANSIALEVEATDRAFLVVGITPHKYWRAQIDSREATPVVTNVGYQGLEIPRGKHVVTMRYANPLVAAGGAISLVAMLICAVLFARNE